MGTRRDFVIAAGAALGASAAPLETSAQPPAKEKSAAPPEAAREFPKGFFWGTATSS